MFFQELKRGFSKISFKVSFLIVSIASIISALQFSSGDNLIRDYIVGYISSPIDEFMLFNLSSISNLIILIMPLLSCLSYSDSYVEDKNSGLIKYIYTRQKKQKYLISKFFANFVISGVSFSLPLILNLIVLYLKYPNVPEHPILGKQNIATGGLFTDLFYNNPTIYILLWLLIYFLYAGLFASIGLSISIFIENRLVVIIIPFILCNLSAFILEAIDKYKWYPLSFLYISNYKSLSIILVEFFILILISFCCFYYGGSKYEVY